MHEQSETVERDGKFFNVYGAATPKAGKVLPGEPAYNTVKEAVTAAKNRSERYGREHNPEGNNMVAPSQSDVRKVDNAMGTDDAKAARYRAEEKAKESPTPTTSERARSLKMMQDKGQDEMNAKGAANAAKGYKAGGSIRGGGCETRGKTKGRMV